MPRNVKESDDEFETKGGRRTRTTLSSSVLDSPLRRSKRIKQPQAHQNDSSPESNSDVSSVGGTRITRRRTTGLEGTITETTRNLRTRRNSATSDISELADNDSPAESSVKRITRRSTASLPSVETPTKLLLRTRRGSRAGSETKSTPPVARVTRRTRASSMEPEVTEETKIHESVTPLKSRRRASALPSEPAVAEESEDLRMEKTVFEIDEDEPEIMHNVSKTSRRKSKGDASEDEKMEVDESPVVESEVDTIEKSLRENTETPSPIVISRVSRKLEDSMKSLDSAENDEKYENSPERDRRRRSRSVTSPVKGSPYMIENLSNNGSCTESLEKSPGNKENEILNTITVSLEKKNVAHGAAAELRFSPRILLNSSLPKITEKRSSISRDDEPLSSTINTEAKIPSSKIIENIAKDADTSREITSIKKDYSLDVECVVLIESLNAKKIASLKTDTPNIRDKQQLPKFNENEMEDAKIRKETEVKEEEIEHNVDTARITNIVGMAGKENESQKDDDEDDDDDDIQIIEITDSTCSIDNEKMMEKISTMEKTTEEVSFNDKSFEKMIILETTMDEVNPKIAENNESTILIEETTCTNSVTPIRQTSGINEEEPKIFKENEKILCETASSKLKTTIIETSINVEVSKKSTDNDDILRETTSTREKTTIIENPTNEEVSKLSKENDKIPYEMTSTSEKTTILEKSINEKISQETKEKDEILLDTTSPMAKVMILETSNNEEDSLKSQREITGIAISSHDAEFINHRSSMDGKILKISDVNEDNIICEIVKDRKSSIVTESPTSRAYAEETSKLTESQVIDESTSHAAAAAAAAASPPSTKINNQQPDMNDDIAKKTKKHRENDEIEIFDSDNESETIVCPSFKDIPADEWENRNDNEDERATRNDADSIHSFSTERNESECELALVDKEPWQQSEIDKREKIVKNGNYDSDDTIIARNENNRAKSDDEDNERENIVDEKLNGEEIPMDVSSDYEDDDVDERSNKIKLSAKKRASFNDSEKFRNENEKIVSNRNKDSPYVFKVSSRKSLLDIDNDSDDSTTNQEANLSKTMANESNVKRSLNAIARRLIDNDSSENENDDDGNEAEGKTPKTVKISRKSLVDSSKRSIDVNSLNTSKSEKRKSLKKSRVDSAENEEILDDPRDEEIEKEATVKDMLEDKSDEENYDREVVVNNTRKDSSDSPEVPEEEINKLELSRSNGKSLNGKNNSKIQLESSETEIEEDEDSPLKLNRSSKLLNNRKSLSSKNNSKIQLEGSDSEIEEEEDSQPKLNRSSKLENNRKSLSSKNNSRIQQQSSDSEIELENLHPILDGSLKLEKNRKSLNSKNNSKIQLDSSDSENEEEEDSQPKLNRSSKLENNRKSLSSKNNSRIKQQSSDSEIELENLHPILDESLKLEKNRKSLNIKNNSKIQLDSSDSENEEEEDSQPKLNRSLKLEINRKSLSSKNNSKIQLDSSNSENEEKQDSQPKLNRSSKLEKNRKSLNSKDNSKIQLDSSDSDIEEEKDSRSKLNRSSKLEKNRKSSNSKNNSKIQQQSSDSEIELENFHPILDGSSKLEKKRKSFSSKNNSITEENNSDSENELDNLHSELNRSSKILKNRKSSSSKNLSFPEPLNSDSDVKNYTESDRSSSNSSSSSEADATYKIPQFLFDANTSSDEVSENSIDYDVANDMNLAGNSVVKYSDDDVPADDCMATESESCDSEDDDGADLIDFVVNDDDEDEEDENEDESSDNEINEKTRKRIIPRPGGDSDSLEDDENTENNEKNSREIITLVDDDVSSKIAKTPKKHDIIVSSKEESFGAIITKSSDNSIAHESEDQDSQSRKISSIVKTPKNEKKQNTSLKNIEIEEIVGSNEMRKNSSKKNRQSMLDTSTPKLASRQNLSFEKSTSAKSNRNVTLDRSTCSTETSRKTLKFELIANDDTTRKFSTSLEEEKIRKTPKSQLQTSLPMSLSNSEELTNLSRIKSPKLSTLCKTMTESCIESPEARFLMKEKLNDTLPALKLQRRTRELRRSVLENFREEDVISEVKLVEENFPTNEDKSSGAKIVETEIVVDTERKNKKKKNKNKNKKKGANESSEITIESIDETPKENAEIVNDSQESVGQDDDTMKKSKKRKRNEKISETMEIEESRVVEEAELSKKKKKKKLKKQEAITEEKNVRDVVTVEKKKKLKKQEPITEEENVLDVVKKNKKKKQEPITEQENIGDVIVEKKNKKKKQEPITERENIRDVVTVEKNKKKHKPKKFVECAEEEVEISTVKLTLVPTENNDSTDISRESIASRKKSRWLDDNKKNNESHDASTCHNGPRKMKTRSATVQNVEKLSTSVKRLSDDFIESLPENSERPKKRRKIIKEDKILPSRSMHVSGGETLKNIKINDDFISLSNCGGTTQFGIVELAKVTKKSKKSVAARSFRERMLSRNPRQPVSAYLIYQQKQKASGKEQRY